MKKSLKILGYGCTDIGQLRSNNEDYFAIADNLFIIADGMGGHSAGEVASGTIVNTISEMAFSELMATGGSATDKDHCHYYYRPYY